ncbi:MAG: FeoB-associated Cys-rich membrane protein [Pyrinomonadaceae bacterium]
MLQNILVIAIITAAVAYATIMLLRKRRAFSVKHGCGSDCGCNDSKQ